MALQSYRLEARSPFHLGQPGIGLESTASFVHSDTFFSAICSALLELYGEERLLAFLALFEGPKPPFVISSGFPFYKKVRFYPFPYRPILPWQTRPGSKEARGAEFVSEKVFDRLLQGEIFTPPDSKNPQLDDIVFRHGGKLWLTRAEIEAFADKEDKAEGREFWQEIQEPHVTVDRLTSRSALFYTGRLVFRPGGGLHFLVEWVDETQEVGQPGLTVRETLENALWHLSLQGIGGNLAVGNGQFVYPEQPDTPALTLVTPSQRYITLSLYRPAEAEWQELSQHQDTAYQLLKREGWIGAPGVTSFQRRPVWMLGEGACLHFKAPRATAELGTLAVVTPNWAAAPDDKQPDNPPKTIYRYGRALALPLKV
jgi:CRISPR-associated protein Csm4